MASLVERRVLFLLCFRRHSAQRLPVKLYTTADGLARNRIQRIVPDSKGFIWASTSGHHRRAHHDLATSTTEPATDWPAA